MTQVSQSPEDSARLRFTGGLTVGVVPMHMVMRGRSDGWCELLGHHSTVNMGQALFVASRNPDSHNAGTFHATAQAGHRSSGG